MQLLSTFLWSEAESGIGPLPKKFTKFQNAYLIFQLIVQGKKIIERNEAMAHLHSASLP